MAVAVLSAKGAVGQRVYAVFWYKLFHLHTFRPWLSWLIWEEMLWFHINQQDKPFFGIVNGCQYVIIY